MLGYDAWIVAPKGQRVLHRYTYIQTIFSTHKARSSSQFSHTKRFNLHYTSMLQTPHFSELQIHSVDENCDIHPLWSSFRHLVPCGANPQENNKWELALSNYFCMLSDRCKIRSSIDFCVRGRFPISMQRALSGRKSCDLFAIAAGMRIDRKRISSVTCCLH